MSDEKTESREGLDPVDEDVPASAPSGHGLDPTDEDVHSGDLRPKETVAIPVTSFDDPHLLPYARNPLRTEKIIGLCLFVGLLGFAAYGGIYFVGGQTQLEGVFAGVGLFAFGFGMSAWGKYLLPQGPFVEDRHPLASTDAEREAMKSVLVDRTTLTFRRRGFLGGLLAAAGGVMGIVLAFPLIRSLAPDQPGKSLDTTNWRKGSLLVDFNGNPRINSSGQINMGAFEQ